MKGSSTVLKRGTVVKNIHLTDDDIIVTDSREAAIANAWQQELETMSLH